MNKKDEIILKQYEIIRGMAERSLSSIASDFWGTPREPAKTVETQEKQPEQTRPAKPEEPAKEETPEE